MIDPTATLLATVQAANDGDEAALAFLRLAAPDLCEEMLGTRASVRPHGGQGTPRADHRIRLTAPFPIP